ncbi:Serine/threonine-protein kinase [Vigna angularis]|uniref:non-specific serine/threonine protein kinase n=1 Tax=Phaseolus angularis TaxID=3914 RepID=A0A8T0LEH8_PHAAN|nr:Serine/threonine-protein kinase [Vigna angularis]
MEKYELVEENVGNGKVAVVKLMRHRETKEHVAVKFIPRDLTVALTPTHLALVMEYAAGGELFYQVLYQGKIKEDNEICHRDLKLENTLLDGSPANRLKICDFGYSKSNLLHSRTHSMVGTPAYIAPEIISGKDYDGKLADVWSCGVILYTMLVGTLPFEDKSDRQNLKKMVQRVSAVQYEFPDNVLSEDSKNLISRIFVANPSKRITMKEIKSHPWFLKNLPEELTEEAQCVHHNEENTKYCVQSIEEIMNIVNEAKTIPVACSPNLLGE